MFRFTVGKVKGRHQILVTYAGYPDRMPAGDGAMPRTPAAGVGQWAVGSGHDPAWADRPPAVYAALAWAGSAGLGDPLAERQPVATRHLDHEVAQPPRM